MKKIEMAEQVALKNLNVTLRNFQNYITKANPSDARLGTLQAIQEKVQTFLKEKNVIPLEDLKSIQASLREDYKNQGDFKAALEKMTPPAAQNPSPPDTVTQKEEAKPVPARPAPITSAQVPAGRGRTQVISRSQPLTQDSLKSSGQEALSPLARQLLNRSQQDSQKTNILKAIDALDKAGIDDAAKGAIQSARKDLDNGKTSADAVRTILSVIKPETKTIMGMKILSIPQDQKSFLKKFMMTEGLQDAMKIDRGVRAALNSFATKLPPNVANEIVLKNIPDMPKAQTTVSNKK